MKTATIRIIILDQTGKGVDSSATVKLEDAASRDEINTRLLGSASPLLSLVTGEFIRRTGEVKKP